MLIGSKTPAIVTGGASGLGAATARALAERGAPVVVFDLDATRGAPHAEAIGGRFVRCDVTSEASVDAALAEARGGQGQERILVNCAGIAIGQRTVRRIKETSAIEPHDIAAFTRVVTVNLIGTFTMIAKSAAGMMAAAPLEPDGERGVIVNTASVAADDGQLGQVAYSASKGGVAAMTLPIARDLARDGIRVVAIKPGLFSTPMFDGLPDDARRALAQSVPFPTRLGDPREFASLAVHVCENTMLNGEAIRLDGAVRLPHR